MPLARGALRFLALVTSRSDVRTYLAVFQVVAVDSQKDAQNVRPYILAGFRGLFFVGGGFVGGDYVGLVVLGGYFE